MPAFRREGETCGRAEAGDRELLEGRGRRAFQREHALFLRLSKTSPPATPNMPRLGSGTGVILEILIPEPSVRNALPLNVWTIAGLRVESAGME